MSYVNSTKKFWIKSLLVTNFASSRVVPLFGCSASSNYKYTMKNTNLISYIVHNPICKPAHSLDCIGYWDFHFFHKKAILCTNFHWIMNDLQLTPHAYVWQTVHHFISFLVNVLVNVRYFTVKGIYTWNTWNVFNFSSGN